MSSIESLLDKIKFLENRQVEFTVDNHIMKTDFIEICHIYAHQILVMSKHSNAEVVCGNLYRVIDILANKLIGEEQYEHFIQYMHRDEDEIDKTFYAQEGIEEGNYSQLYDYLYGLNNFKKNLHRPWEG